MPVKTIAIPIADDGLAQGDRTFNLTLTNPQGGTTLDTVSSSVVTIREDAVQGPAVLVPRAARQAAIVRRNREALLRLGYLAENRVGDRSAARPAR